MRSRQGGLALVLCAVAALTATMSYPQDAPAAAHRMIKADEIVWGPAPPGLPPGSQAAVISGDPSKSGPFTLRAGPDARRLPHPSPLAPHG